MINKLKKIIPNGIKAYYWRYLKQKEKDAKKRIKFDDKTPKDTFTFIYETNYWSGRDSISGGGSDLAHTQVLIKQLPILLKEIHIKSILDIPCGDFFWMHHADLSNINYMGGDIVDSLIERNIEKYYSIENVQFKVMDLLVDSLPQCDILINRDCLVHLSFDDIYKALKNIKNSNCEYLLTTTFPNHTINKDITTGEWRTLNLEMAPFNFPSPIKSINEEFKHPEFGDKTLALWRISDINLNNFKQL